MAATCQPAAASPSTNCAGCPMPATATTRRAGRWHAAVHRDRHAPARPPRTDGRGDAVALAFVGRRGVGRRRPPPGPRRGPARRAARAAGPWAARDRRPARRPASRRCRDRGRAAGAGSRRRAGARWRPSADSAWRPGGVTGSAPTTTQRAGHGPGEHQRLVAGRAPARAARERRRRPPPARRVRSRRA